MRPFLISFTLTVIPSICELKLQSNRKKQSYCNKSYHFASNRESLDLILFEDWCIVLSNILELLIDFQQITRLYIQNQIHLNIIIEAYLNDLIKIYCDYKDKNTSII